MKSSVAFVAVVVILEACGTAMHGRRDSSTIVTVYNNNRNGVKVALTKTDGFLVLRLGAVESNGHDTFSLPEEYLHDFWRIRLETTVTHQVWYSETFQCTRYQEVTVAVNDVLRDSDFSVHDLEEGDDTLSTDRQL